MVTFTKTLLCCTWSLVKTSLYCTISVFIRFCLIIFFLLKVCEFDTIRRYETFSVESLKRKCTIIPVNKVFHILITPGSLLKQSLCLKISSWRPSSTMCVSLHFICDLEVPLFQFAFNCGYTVKLHIVRILTFFWVLLRIWSTWTLIILKRHSTSWNTRATQKNWVIPTESPPESWSNISSASTAVLLNFIYNLMQVRSSNLWTIVKPFQHITKSRIIIEYLETHEWQTDSLSLAQICVEWYGHGEYNFNLITNSKLIFLDYHFSLYLQSIRIFLQFFMDFECLHFYVYILFEMNALPSYNCVRQSEYDLIHKMRMPYFTPLCRT